MWKDDDQFAHFELNRAAQRNRFASQIFSFSETGRVRRISRRCRGDMLNEMQIHNMPKSSKSLLAFETPDFTTLNPPRRYLSTTLTTRYTHLILDRKLEFFTGNSTPSCQVIVVSPTLPPRDHDVSGWAGCSFGNVLCFETSLRTTGV
jgi:hypothetical protein